MSNQNDRGSNQVTYDDGDIDEPLYNYGRPFVKGWQQGFLLRATCRTWPDGGKQIDAVIGTGCPTMPGKGTKTDLRVRIPSHEYGEFLSIMGVVPVKGQPIDLEGMKNRELDVNLGEEVDRKKSEETGQKVMRAKAICIAAANTRRPKAAAPPPAAASQPKPPAFA